MASLLLEDLPEAHQEVRAANTSAAEGGTASAERLLPLSLAGVFDEAFDLYKRHFRTLAVITAVLMLPLLVALQALESLWLHPLAVQTNWSGDEAEIGRAFLILLGYFFIGAPREIVPGVLSLAALVLVGGAVTVVVGDIYAGRQPTVRAALRGIGPHLFRLLGGWLMACLAFCTTAFLASFAVMIFLGIVTTLLSAASGQILAAALGILFLVCLTILPYLAGTALVARFFLFLTPTLILERLPISAAPGRIAQLTGKRLFWRVWLTATFLPLAMVGLSTLMLLALDSALELLSLAPLFDFVLHVALATAIFLFFQPYWMVCLTLLYFDSRIRREAFDLQVLSAGLPPILPGAWALPEGKREEA